MFMLRETAHKHGLEIMPYHWMWCSNIAEATLAADIANYFDGCCPDIEDPFNNQPGWALEYGKVIRQRAPHRLFYPTLYANPQQHTDQPYAQYEQWIDGWMPMVYFSEWREAGLPMTAQEAIDFVFPQWKHKVYCFLCRHGKTGFPPFGEVHHRHPAVDPLLVLSVGLVGMLLWVRIQCWVEQTVWRSLADHLPILQRPARLVVEGVFDVGAAAIKVVSDICCQGCFSDIAAPHPVVGHNL